MLAMQLAYGLSWSGFLLLPKFLTLELGASPSEVGTVSAVPSLVAALLVPLVAAHIDRLGRKPPIVLGTALSTAYALGFLSVTEVGPWLFFLQLIQGVAFCFQFNGASTLVADLSPRERMAQAIGIFGAANVATNAIAPAIAEPLAAHMGWRAAFTLSAAMGALACALALSLQAPAAASTEPEPAAPGAPLRQLRYVLAMATCGVGLGCAFTFYQPFAISLGMTEVGSFFIGYAGVVVLVRLTLGGVIDRVGRGRAAVGALVWYALSLAALTRLSPETLTLCGASLGIAHGLLFPSLLALAVDHGAPAQRGRIVTYVNGGFQVGMTLSVFGLGWVAEWAGFPAAFLIASACTAVGAVLLLPDLGPAGRVAATA